MLDELGVIDMVDGPGKQPPLAQIATLPSELHQKSKRILPKRQGGPERIPTLEGQRLGSMKCSCNVRPYPPESLCGPSMVAYCYCDDPRPAVAPTRARAPPVPLPAPARRRFRL